MTPPVLYFDLGNTLVYGPTGNKVPFADAVATIQTLWERGYRIGLLSDQSPGTSIDDVRTKLDDYGLESSKFDVITISSEFSPPKYKPDPDIFQHALGKAGYASASDRTVFVTEALAHVEAARDLGWRAIHVPYQAACGPQSGECIEALDDLLDLFPPLAIDLYLRDSSADDGDEPSSGAFWNSPDLWVRNVNDSGTAHQNPIAGQDNWFHARLHNRGEGIARTVVVGHTVQEWAGTEFVHPADYAAPTALVGAFDVEPDVARVLVAKWDAADVPPAGTHACWLSAVYTNGDPIAAGSHVWDANNLAQKNLTVVEMSAGESAELAMVIGNRAIGKARRIVLELWQAEGGPALAATLASDSVRALARAVARAGRLMPSAPPVKAEPSVGLRFLDPARVELTGLLEQGGEALILELAPGSAMTFPPAAADARGPMVRRPAPLTARLVEDAKGVGTVAFGAGPASGIALGLREAEFMRTRLTLRAPRDARPGERTIVDLVQRDADGIVVGGVSVAVVIMEGKTKKASPKAATRSHRTARQRRRKG